MDRQEFISRLTQCLGGMAERDEILSYYGELIDDGVESGKSEQEVIAGFAPPEEIARGVAEEEERPAADGGTADGSAAGDSMAGTAPHGARPDATNAADKPAGTARPVMTPDLKESASALRVTAIVLLILCSPVIFSLFVSVYAVLVSLFASAAGLLLGGGVYVLASAYLLFTAPYVGLFQLGASLALAGGGILLLIGTLKLWQLTVRFTVYCFGLFRKGGNHNA
mgnify:FL=1